ncbi:E3 ubiquitin-protein ligase NEURL3 [Leptodactylus fuscus]|uniref:E3 ubiquitin-protein ligase NEURL3 n=1 Tax=Leptodactylus fuscus TaxID=238119 RepID=UPI003F4EAB88
MGLTCSSAAQGLSFHPRSKGCNVHLDSCCHRAQRNYSFHDGIVFSNRPLRPREKVWIRILEVEPRWHGALRVGFTSVDPNLIDSTALPPYACPDLTNTPEFWAIGIPEEMCMEGEEFCFWVNRKGQALFKKRGNMKPRVLFSSVPKKTRLWVMLDVYGQTKALQLLDAKTKQQFSPCCRSGNTESQNLGSHHLRPTVTKEKAVHAPSPELCMKNSTKEDLRTELKNLRRFPEEEPDCVICQDRIADTLLLPCGHCSFCKHCVLKFRRQSSTCPLCRQSIVATQCIREEHSLASCGSQSLLQLQWT